jgi:hypothetical protein
MTRPAGITSSVITATGVVEPSEVQPRRLSASSGHFIETIYACNCFRDSRCNVTPAVDVGSGGKITWYVRASKFHLVGE